MNYSGQSTIVIGDTTRDVISAKSAGARSIALTTGTDNQELLETVKPDFIFQDLCDLDGILKAITGEL
jgi:phosphoglycolate phosphatase-like HAD superfamily hydrolase